MDVSVDLFTLLQVAVVVPVGAALSHLITRIRQLEEEMKSRPTTDEMHTHVALSQKSLEVLLQRILVELDSISKRIDKRDKDE